LHISSGTPQDILEGPYHFFFSASQTARSSLCEVLMKRKAPNFSATSWRYWRISAPGAYIEDQRGFGAKLYWYEWAVFLVNRRSTPEAFQ